MTHPKKPSHRVRSRLGARQVNVNVSETEQHSQQVGRGSAHWFVIARAFSRGKPLAWPANNLAALRIDV